MDRTQTPNLLELPTQSLLDKFGAGSHKPGSGSAAALLGLVACKMMQTVTLATLRAPRYKDNFSKLKLLNSAISEKHEPFFREAVQKDSLHFDRYHQAKIAQKNCKEESAKRRLSDDAREKLKVATQIPLDIAEHAAETAETGIIIYDLGATYVRGDSGVAVSSALSFCSGALFVVYLNLLQFREGSWAARTRANADSIKDRYDKLQSKLFDLVSRIQSEGVADPQLELGL